MEYEVLELEKNEIMIAVCLVTFNQEKYISEAIESVLSQKVDIPFKLFIGDDSSSDKTTEICRCYKENYASKIEHIINSSNLGLVLNTIQLLETVQKLGCEYVAILDGDDYWNDNSKLQKQINIFKSDSNIGLVHSNCEILWNNKLFERKSKKNPLQGYVFNSIDAYNISNSTVIFKSELLRYIDIVEFRNQGLMSCDYAMYAIFSKYTKFGFIEDFTAVWRRGHSSVSNTNSIKKDIDYISNDINMWKYLGKLFPDRFQYNETQLTDYHNYRKFNIAFKYGDFKLAKESCFLLKNYKKNSIFKLKKIAAKNILLFKFWVLVKNLFRRY